MPSGSGLRRFFVSSAVTKTLRCWRLRYSDPHSWLISLKFFEAPASTVLCGPQYRSGSARGCGPVSRPPKRGPSSFFRGALVAPASALLCGAQFWSGRWIFYPQHGYRSQQRQQWSAQQIAVPRPAHLHDETDNVATILNSDRCRVAVV